MTLRRFISLLLKLIAAAGLVLVLFLVAMVVALNVPTSRHVLLRQVSALVSGPDFTLTLDGDGGRWPFSPSFAKIAISDSQGNWLEIADAVLAVDPWALLKGRLHVRQLTAASVTVSRLPAATAPAPAPSRGPFELPRLPRGLKVDRIAVQLIDIAAAVAGTPVKLALIGQVGVAEDDALVSHLRLADRTGKGLHVILDGRVQPDLKHVSVHAVLDDAPSGLVNGLLGLGGRQPVHLAVAAEGPLDALALTADVALAGAHLHVTAKARKGDDGLYALRVRAAGDPGRFVPAAYEPVVGHAVTLDLTGKAGTDRFDVASATLAMAAATLDLKGHYAPNGGHGDMTLAVTDPARVLGLAPLAGVPPDLLPKSVKARADFPADFSSLDVTAFNLAAPAATVSGRIALTDGLTHLAAALKGRIDTLADIGVRVAPDAGLAGSGTIVATAEGTITPLDLAVSLDVVGAGFSAAAPVGALAGAVPRLTVGGRMTETTVRIDKFVLALAAGTATATGTVDEKARRVALTIGAEVPDLGSLGLVGWGGAARLDGKITGGVSAPEVALNLKAQKLVVAGHDLGDPVVEVAGKPDLEGLSQGTVHVVTGGAYPAQMSAGWHYDGQHAGVTALAAEGFGVKLTGDADYNLETGLADSHVAINAADLKGLDPLLHAGLAGGLAADVTLSGAGGRQQGTVVMDLARVAGPGFSLSRATAKLTLGDLKHLAFTVDAAGATPIAFDLAAGGRAERSGDGGTVLIDHLRGTLGGQNLALAKALSIVIGPAIKARGINLHYAAAKLSGDLTYGHEVTGKLILAGVNPKDFSVLAGTDLPKGRINVTAELNGARGGHLDLTAAGFDPHAQVPTIGSMPNLKLTARLAWAGGGERVTAAVTGVPGTSLSAKGTVPVTFASGLPLPNMTGRLALSVTMASVLGKLAAVLPLGENRVSGRAHLALAVAGRLDAPALSGTFNLDQGSVAVFASGTELTDLTAAVAFDGSTARLKSFTAKDGRGGRLKIGGVVENLLSGDPALGLTMKVRGFGFSRTDLAVVRGDADLTLGGRVSAPAVAGKITLTQGLINIAARLPVSIPNVKVRRRGHRGRVPGGQATVAKLVATTRPPVRDASSLHLTVKIPDRFFVRGRGLESEWQGQIKIVGTLSKPVVQGGFKVVRGHFSLGSKVLTLSAGSVTFPSGLEAGPELHIMATGPAGDATAKIMIEGPASAIRITLSSEPALPNNEILSHLLFGTSVSNLSALQALSLGQAALALLGHGGGGTLDKIGSALGLDSLSQSGESGLSAGRYITPGVYVGVDDDLKTNTPNAKIEVEVAPHISVDGTTSAGSSGSSVGLNYKFNY